MGGGGSHNPNIISYLREQFPRTRITRIDEIGIPVGAKEALGFALLGCECFVGRPMIVPRRTESDCAGVVGQIQPGANHHRIRQHVAQVSDVFQGSEYRKVRWFPLTCVQFWGDFPEEDIKCTTSMRLLPSICS